MIGIEIVILIVGVIFVLGSFFVGEKLSSKDIDYIAEMTKAQLSRIVEKELKNAEGTIEDMVDKTIEDSVLKIERMMDKETNVKIMSISEYSDTVLEEINKTHGEVMFLYSMLNDKHTELTNLANQISQLVSMSKKAMISDEVITNENTRAERKDIYSPVELVQEDKNHNHLILEMGKMGMEPIAIAKELGLGIGEVKLVMDLYKGDSKG